MRPAAFPSRFAATAAAFLAISAMSSPGRTEPGDELSVSVLTFGPGDHPFFKFGHNAIMVQPRTRGEPESAAELAPGWVYNFGTFAFDSPALIPKFLRGRFKYWLSVSSVEDTLQSYAAANRSILAQELDLDAGQKWALARALRENARPENREYLYDYFRDNCSTRVRDAVDRIVEGRVHKAGQVAASGTFRSHALRMVADLWPEYVGIYLGLGRAADVPINRWEEAFLPDKLADLLRTVRLPDASGEKPLVKSESVLHAAKRPEKPVTPPSWGVYFLLLGVCLGATLALLGRLARRFAASRIALGGLLAVVGGSFGLVGLIMVALWAFTDHRIAYANANILQFGPWAVALFGHGIGVALGRQKSTRRARVLVLSLAACSLLGILCKTLPGANQDNWPFILFCLPAWLGMLRGLHNCGIGSPGRVPKPSRDGLQA